MLTHSLLVNYRIYLHLFTNNKLEIFIVSELVQANPNNSRAMSALTFNYAMLYKYGKHMYNYYMHLIDFVTPPNSNAFSDWRRTRHVPWIKSL